MYGVAWLEAGRRLIKLHDKAAGDHAQDGGHIQASGRSAAEIAGELDVNEPPCGAGRSARTPLTRPSHAVELHIQLDMFFDAAFEVMRRSCRSELFRAALHLPFGRRGVSRRPAEPKPTIQTLEPQPFDYVDVNLSV